MDKLKKIKFDFIENEIYRYENYNFILLNRQRPPAFL